MRKNDSFSENTMKSKISYGRRIFKKGLEKKALETIIKSERQEKATITKAAKLLEKMGTGKAKPSQKVPLPKGKEKAKKTVVKAKVKV
jgi:Mn-dependent DtxR family transcriptional regulator